MHAEFTEQRDFFRIHKIEISISILIRSSNQTAAVPFAAYPVA